MDWNEFQSPGARRRGAVFWSWGRQIDKKVALRQIDYFKEMGLGGVFIHPRTGLDVPYLGEEYMELVKACLEKGKENRMYTYLYDEDRWPSGFAGGYVTKNEKYRARQLMFTPVSYEEYGEVHVKPDFSVTNFRTGNGRLLACFDIVLDEDGYLESYTSIGATEKAKGTKWYAYLETAMESPWFNGQTNVDVLNKAAIDEFIAVTYEAYKKQVGEDFGGWVPAIFTDEPQTGFKTVLAHPFEKKDVFLPWTDDIEQTFKAEYQENLLQHVPRLVWESKEASPLRWQYHNHVADRFSQSFCKNIGDWCRKNGIAFTGHLVSEGKLISQTENMGDVMRCYPYFDIPGADNLFDCMGLDAFKAVASVAHQEGKRELVSEIYGTTDWDFDLRDHKFQGDWQAALGVTLRIFHLSMYSMQGEAKRDYPASINYQSPWYREYKSMEDYYARIGSVITSTRPVIRVGVIYPIESMWQKFGNNQQNARAKTGVEESYQALIHTLLFGTVDFDFISEALLPEQYQNDGKIGEMKYEVILVSGCETLRSTTVEILERYKNAGGHLVFIGKYPECIDAMPTNRSFTDALVSERELLNAVEPFRDVAIVDENNVPYEKYIYSLREDEQARYLFIASAKKEKNIYYASKKTVRVILRGEYAASVCDAFSGTIQDIHADYGKDTTELSFELYENDSILLKLTAGKSNVPQEIKAEEWKDSAALPSDVDYMLEEPNVLLLDKAEYAFDGGAWMEKKEILRIDNEFRDTLGLPLRMDVIVEAWARENRSLDHTLTLKFSFISEIDVEGARLASENLCGAEIEFNGERISNEPTGWYVDEYIHTVDLPKIHSGKNELVMKIPFGEAADIEWCYILGDFGVKVCGDYAVITQKPEKIHYGDLTTQGFPFYGGNVQYLLPLPADCKLKIGQYVGALVKVGDTQVIFPPYECNIKEGGTLPVTLYGNRFNTFGALHYADRMSNSTHPNSWRTKGEMWCDEYMLRPFGILVKPMVLVKGTD